MTPGDWRDRAITILDARLRAHASRLLLERLREATPAALTTPEELDGYLRKVRATIRLFIDEELADEVCRELRAVAPPSSWGG